LGTGPQILFGNSSFYQTENLSDYWTREANQDLKEHLATLETEQFL